MLERLSIEEASAYAAIMQNVLGGGYDVRLTEAESIMRLFSERDNTSFVNYHDAVDETDHEIAMAAANSKQKDQLKDMTKVSDFVLNAVGALPHLDITRAVDLYTTAFEPRSVYSTLPINAGLMLGELIKTAGEDALPVVREALNHSNEDVQSEAFNSLEAVLADNSLNLPTDLLSRLRIIRNGALHDGVQPGDYYLKPEEDENE